MRTSDLVSLLWIGSAVFIVYVILWFVLKKRKKWAIVLPGILLIAYSGYVFYYPTMQKNTHAERYDQLTEFLSENYPKREFNITPEEYGEEYVVGSFTVHDIDSPTMGVEMAVNRAGDVTETAYWHMLDSLTQQELWKGIEFSYEGAYTLDRESPEIAKLDEWMDGGLTAFALSINDRPAIALFDYSDGGYSQLDLQEGEKAGYVSAEYGGYVFIYMDEQFTADTLTVHSADGSEYTVNAGQKGRLIVEK